MSRTKFVVARGTKNHPVSQDASTLLSDRNCGSVEELMENTAERLQDICRRTITTLDRFILAEESSIQDVEEKISLNEETSDNVKEMFWGKNWRHYVNKLQNRKKQHRKMISTYSHLIDLIGDNMYTDDLDTACDLVEFYFKYVEKIPEDEIKRSIVGDTVIYRFPDVLIEHRSPSNVLEGRHAIMQRFNSGESE